MPVGVAAGVLALWRATRSGIGRHEGAAAMNASFVCTEWVSSLLVGCNGADGCALSTFYTHVNRCLQRLRSCRKLVDEAFVSPRFASGVGKQRTLWKEGLKVDTSGGDP
jgi:hypothetical protein